MTNVPMIEYRSNTIFQATIRSEHLVVDAMEAYTIATREIPVHLIWGTIYDVAYVHECGLRFGVLICYN